MAWTYEVSTTRFCQNGIYRFDAQYCGAPGYKNNPQFQCLKNQGPLPIGSYIIGSPYNSPNTGRFTLGLTPHAGNDMCGRDGFRIHGDSRKAPGAASHGCIVVSLISRQEIWNSGDRELIVE